MRYIVIMLCLVGSTTHLFAQDSSIVGQQSPETFEMEWGDSTIVMQKYFVVFLKSGPTRSQSKEEATKIQEKHLAYLDELYQRKKVSMTGPAAGKGDIRGIVIYNTATKEEAKRLAEQDPAVKAGRLVVEVLPWWAAKGSKLK